MLGLFSGKTKDPVCGMDINKKETKFSFKSNGSIYYFCSQNCKEKFGDDSKKYLKDTSHEKECCH